MVRLITCPECGWLVPDSIFLKRECPYCARWEAERIDQKKRTGKHRKVKQNGNVQGGGNTPTYRRSRSVA